MFSKHVKAFERLVKGTNKPPSQNVRTPVGESAEHVRMCLQYLLNGHIESLKSYIGSFKGLYRAL